MSLKLPPVHTSLFFNSLFNTARSLINPLFIALVSYVLIRWQQQEQLKSINQVNALVNLFLMLSGWGLKDYLVKESHRSPVEFSANWHQAFYSKIILLLPLLALAVALAPRAYLPFILLLALLRTFNMLYEPLVLLHKKSTLFFIVDGGSALIVTGLMMAQLIHTYATFFYLLSLGEAIRLLVSYNVFRLPGKKRLSLRELFGFLKSTRFYFFLVLASFVQGRVDLYLLGFLFSPGKLNEYQLLSSLLALAQVVIASFVVSYSKLFYRNIADSGRRFRRMVMRTGSLVAVGSAVLIYIILNYIYGFRFLVLNVPLAALNIIAFSATLCEMYEYTRRDWLHKTLVFVILAAVINSLLCLLFIPAWGITGALLCNTLALLVLPAGMALQRISWQRREKI